MCVSLLCLLVFSSMLDNSLIASATGEFIVNSDAWSDYYSHLSGQYLGRDGLYHQCTFDMTDIVNATWNVDIHYIEGLPVTQNMYGRKVAVYASSVTYSDIYNSDWQEYKLWIDLNLHVSNCTYFNSGFVGYMYPNGASFFNMNYQSVKEYNYADIYIMNDDSNNPDKLYIGSDQNGTYPVAIDGYNKRHCGALYPFYTQSATDYYMSQIGMSCVENQGSDPVYICVVLPEVSAGSVLEEQALPVVPDPDPDWGDGQSVGEVTGTIEDQGNGTQNINVTVNTDNTGFLAGILNGLRSLFIPSAEDMEEFTSDLQGEFEEHLGGVAEAVDLIDEQAEYFRAAVSVNTVYFPELEIPIDGDDYTIIEGQQVELRPANTSSGLSVLWNAVAIAVDIVCVLAVLNMLQTKYEIFLNPDGEVITYDS